MSQLVASSKSTTNLRIWVEDTRGNRLKGHTIKLTTDLGIVSSPTDNGDGIFLVPLTQL